LLIKVLSHQLAFSEARTERLDLLSPHPLQCDGAGDGAPADQTSARDLLFDILVMLTQVRGEPSKHALAAPHVFVHCLCLDVRALPHVPRNALQVASPCMGPGRPAYRFGGLGTSEELLHFVRAGTVDAVLDDAASVMYDIVSLNDQAFYSQALGSRNAAMRQLEVSPSTQLLCAAA